MTSTRSAHPVALDEAHRMARRAVQLNPNLPQAHASLDVVLAWKRHHDEGVAEFEKAVALIPISPMADGNCTRLRGPLSATPRRG